MAARGKSNSSTDDEDFEVKSPGGSEDRRFDEAIGCLQDILLDEQFIVMQRGFLEEHYTSFEDVEENKLEYMDIFKKYSQVVEEYLEKALRSKINPFSMDKFLTLLQSRRKEVGEEILDLLASFSDFLVFKQTILDYKAEKEGRSLDLSGLIVESMRKH